MSYISRLSVAAAVSAAFVANVGAKELDPELRQYVIASCSSDAYRLCPESLMNEEKAVSCMKSKRSELGQICRVAYDKAARVLRQ